MSKFRTVLYGTTRTHECAERARRKTQTKYRACAGSFSGAVVSVCVQPLDVVRTRLQADAAKGISRSTAGAFRVLVQEQGVRYSLQHEGS